MAKTKNSDVLNEYLLKAISDPDRFEFGDETMDNVEPSARASFAKRVNGIMATIGLPERVRLIKEIEGNYGVTTILKFVTAEGNACTWFASGSFTDEAWVIGTEYLLAGTVKRNDVYQDKLRAFARVWKSHELTGSVNREDVETLAAAAEMLKEDPWNQANYFSNLFTQLKRLIASVEVVRTMV